MNEISVFDDAVFKLLDELYRLNHRKWQKQILTAVAQGEKKNYRQLKAKLQEVPDLLVYRCIEELVDGQVLKRIKDKQYTFYILENENVYIREILKEL